MGIIFNSRAQPRTASGCAGWSGLSPDCQRILQAVVTTGVETFDPASV